jgi:hypothetical protein
MATISDHGSLLSTERNGDRAAFIAARGSYGSSHGGRGSRGGYGFRGGRDFRGGGRIGGRWPHKYTHCGRSNLWSFVGTYMVHHLGLSIRFLLIRILQLQLDNLLDRALLSRMISSPFLKMSMLST